ncbi:MAG: cytochrome c [Candidatus Brocadia sp.]|nr:cytochrome c [Candidatus Brocadia sp.]
MRLRAIVVITFTLIATISDLAGKGQTDKKVQNEHLTKKNPFARGDKSAFERGEYIYSRKCVKCHGEKGDGTGSLLEGVKVPVFNNGYFSEKEDGHVFRIVEQGLPDTLMPSFGPGSDDILSAGDIWKLIVFMRRRFGEKIPYEYLAKKSPFARGDKSALERGEYIYSRKCVKCHGEKGDGAGSILKGVKMPVFNNGYFSEKEDGQVFWIVEHGLSGTLMPSYGPGSDDILSADDVWKVIVFMRTRFGEKIPYEYLARKNPFARSDKSALGRGEYIYSRKCVKCHGEKGDGTGSILKGIKMPVFNKEYFSKKEDGYIFWIIEQGLPDTLMSSFGPGSAEVLSSDDIWKTIAFTHDKFGK